MSDGHLKIRLKVNSPQVGQTCPVSSVTFQQGDDVVLCERSGIAFSLKAWQEYSPVWGGSCPFCNPSLDAAREPAIPAKLPGRRVGVPIWAIAAAGASFVLCALVVSVLLLSGRTGGSRPGLTSIGTDMFPVPSSTPTRVVQVTAEPPTPTRTQPPTHTPTSRPPTRTPTPRSPTRTPTPRSTLLLEWAFIPDANFTMGSSQTDIQIALAECNETEGKRTGRSCQTAWFNEPQRTVFVNDFEVTKYEITNIQYKECVAAGVCEEAGRQITDNNIPFDPIFFADAYPVVGVSWYDADTFCRWVGGRLPTEVEWERAARGDDGRRYPWGDTFDYTRANLDSGHPAPVGTFPTGSSPYGVMDMAGNVFEWTATREKGDYVVRGGGWSKYYFRGRVTDRGTQLEPNFANYDIGFRCAK
jgi:formylglycine-generating enzyme required for sulfatase activity